MKPMTKATVVMAALGLLVTANGAVRAALVGHWTFDGDFTNSGTAGSALDGTAVDNAQVVTNISDGFMNRASVLALDGTNDQVTINDTVTNLYSTAAFTIAAWVKTTGTRQGILGKDDGGFKAGTKHFFLNANVTPGGFGHVGHSQNWIRTTSTANDGNWHHVAVSNNPGSWQRVYIDGVHVTTQNNFSGGSDTGNILRIGYSTWSEAGYYNGHIDDLRIYNAALDTSDFESLFDAGSPGDTISIDFDENGRTGTTATGTFGPTSGGLVGLPVQTGAWNALGLGDGANTPTASGTVSGGIAAPTASGLLADGSANTTPTTFTFNTTSQTYQVYTQDVPLGNSDNLGRDVPYLTGGDAGNVIGWQFDNLVPNTAYALRLFGQSDQAGPANYAVFAVTGGSPASATTSASLNYVDFSVTSNGSGQIVGTFAGSGTSSWSGIQIRGEFVPEPSSLILALLGLLALPGYARRERRTKD